LPATNRGLSRLAGKLSNSSKIISGNYPQGQLLTMATSDPQWPWQPSHAQVYQLLQPELNIFGHLSTPFNPQLTVARCKRLDLC
jgi:hypothetical protein